MLKLKNYEFWFVTGSQPLYGPEVIDQVSDNSKKVVEGLNAKKLPYKIVFKKVATDSKSIQEVCNEANMNENCAGIITWMHTFSPAKMWIHGLTELRKPLLHLHTQFNKEIPWGTIDMDFMNLNQAAHGDREFGYIGARLDIPRKIVVGHWSDDYVAEDISKWMAPAVAVTEGRSIKVARFGDNMRDVAVTDGDRIEAEIKFGWTIDYYGVGDLVASMENVTEGQIDELMSVYKDLYDIDPNANIDSIREQAKIEIGIKTFLDKGGYTAFTTNFQALHGMKQLPGLAAQHLMAEG
ncbi:MAG: L-arabinose isomerase, partial [Clostridioides difficile]|nr:L-arabinose isomerase [Clostridioides difficile]